jgi:hypothetical protein
MPPLRTRRRPAPTEPAEPVEPQPGEAQPEGEGETGAPDPEQADGDA